MGRCNGKEGITKKKEGSKERAEWSLVLLCWVEESKSGICVR